MPSLMKALLKSADPLHTDECFEVTLEHSVGNSPLLSLRYTVGGRKRTSATYEVRRDELGVDALDLIGAKLVIAGEAARELSNYAPKWNVDKLGSISWFNAGTSTFMDVFVGPARLKGSTGHFMKVHLTLNRPPGRSSVGCMTGTSTIILHASVEDVIRFGNELIEMAVDE